MSKAKEKQAEVIPIHTMPLPESIPLKESQRYSLNAFANDDARMNQQIEYFEKQIEEIKQQIAQRQQAIAQTQAARLSVLAEVAADNGIEPAILNVNYIYIYNATELVKPKAQE